MIQGFTSEYVMDICITTFKKRFKINYSFIVISERPTFLRERTAMMYRTSAYYFAKLVADLPFEFLWPTIFGSIVYFSVR